MLLPLFAVPFASQALASPLFRRADDPLKPSADPFYQPDAGWIKAEPGTILKNRSIESSVGPADVKAWQLLYVSTQSNGTKMATVTTIFKDSGAKNDSIIGYSSAEDANFIDCTSSYVYQKGSTSDNTVLAAEAGLIGDAIKAGSIVVSSDYEGPNSAFAAGRQSGHGVLDGLRAAINFGSTIGLSTKDPKIALWGYSGGAIATGWASSLASSYAPKLNIVGAAFGGTPADLAGTFRYLDGTLFSGFGFAGTAGLISSYPELNPVFDKYATEAGKEALNFVWSHCSIQDIFKFAYKKLQTTNYTTLGDKLLDNPTVKSVTDQLVLGKVKSETPQFPLLVYHAKADEIIPIEDVRTMVANWCRNGIKSLNFVTNIGPVEHITYAIAGSGDAIKFLQARINGEAPVSGCVNTTRLL